MQLREIMDLEAMLSKGPTAEQISEEESEGGEGGEAEISEKTAGPSIKEDEEPEEEAPTAEEDEEAMIERRTPRPVDDDDDDNALSLAQMEEQLKRSPRSTRSSASCRLPGSSRSAPAPNIPPPRRRSIRSSASN